MSFDPEERNDSFGKTMSFSTSTTNSLLPLRVTIRERETGGIFETGCRPFDSIIFLDEVLDGVAVGVPGGVLGDLSQEPLPCGVWALADHKQTAFDLRSHFKLHTSLQRCGRGDGAVSLALVALDSSHGDGSEGETPCLYRPQKSLRLSPSGEEENQRIFLSAAWSGTCSLPATLLCGHHYCPPPSGHRLFPLRHLQR